MWLSVPDVIYDESQEDQTLLACDLMDTSHNLRHFIIHVMTRAQQLLHVATTLALYSGCALCDPETPPRNPHGCTRLGLRTYAGV